MSYSIDTYAIALIASWYICQRVDFWAMWKFYYICFI